MEYERTPDGQIQSAFAQRAGQLVVQYEALCRQLPIGQQYESTLAVALLQSMLTTGQELLRRGTGKGKSLPAHKGLLALARRSLFDEPALLGLEPDCLVECWSSTRGLIYREVFECLRNALSHPGPQRDTKYPTTGFSTCESGSGYVETYEFVHSPWVNSRGSALTPRFAPTELGTSSKLRLEVEVRNWGSNYAVDGLSVSEGEQGQWQVLLGGRLFVPVLRVRLNTRQLRTLTATLSDYLAAPLARLTEKVE